MSENRNIPDDPQSVAAADARARERERLQTEIYYRGFAYNVRSQWGIDSLKRAIERNGDG